MSAPNPYESPLSGGSPFSTDSTTPSDLERRVAELERRVGRSWFLSNQFLARVFVVWAYLLMGYVMILAVIMPIVYLIGWLFPRF
jgi:hypothetical protein